MNNLKLIGICVPSVLALGLGVIFLADAIRPSKVKDRSETRWKEAVDEAINFKDKDRERIRKRYQKAYNHKEIESLIDLRMSRTNYVSEAERLFTKAQMLHFHYGSSESRRQNISDRKNKYRGDLVWEYTRDWYKMAADLDIQISQRLRHLDYESRARLG